MRKTHVIDGKKYVEVGRKAEVGDYVLVTEFSNEIVREIRKVVRLSRFNGDFYLDEPIDEETYFDNNDDRYRTVKPVESEECCDNTKVTDLLANLARRVSSLEQQLRDTQRNLETFAEQTESNSEDIRTLDARTQPKVLSEFDQLIEAWRLYFENERGGRR
jgi:hypothetical protein